MDTTAGAPAQPGGDIEVQPPLRRGGAPPWAVPAVVCLSVYVINLDTIVNAALPTLVEELEATNRDLQWVVDAYNLTFAGFVLAAGGLADRYGRRGALMVGLLVFGSASPPGPWPAGGCSSTSGGAASSWRWRRSAPWRSS